MGYPPPLLLSFGECYRLRKNGAANVIDLAERVCSNTPLRTVILEDQVGVLTMSSDKHCLYTHRWLLAGACPFCNRPILNGQEAPTASSGGSRLSWNIPALLLAFDHNDPRMRRFVIWTLGEHGPTPEESLPILRRALLDPDVSVRSETATALSFLARRLQIDEVNNLEAHFQRDPHDLAARSLLLVYYFKRDPVLHQEQVRRRHHILWIIRNAPKSDVAGSPFCEIHPRLDPAGYTEAKRQWCIQIDAHPKDVSILENAARFFLPHDKELCHQLLQRGKQLQPEAPIWSRLLGTHHQLKTKFSSAIEDQQQASQEALAELEAAWAKTDNQIERFEQLGELAKLAFASADFAKARRYAEALLSGVAIPEYALSHGDAIHSGNLILGRLALRDGDVELAKHYLLEAGRTPGSPSLCTFGPNMMLAKELLEQNEWTVVLDYLQLCSQFWHTSDQRIDQWIASVQHRVIPSFGANLLY